MTNLQTIDLRNNMFIKREHVMQLRSQYPGVVSDFDGSFQQISIDDQEALLRQRELVIKAFKELALSEATAQLVTANLPVTESNIKEKFINAAADMQTLLEQALAMNDLKFTDGQKFRLKTALRSLLLLKGNDDKIERHVTSSLESYANYAYHGLPNIRQLFVLAYNLLSGPNVEQQQKEFVVAYLANSDRWNTVKTIFDIKNTLGQELQKSNNVVNALCNLMKDPELKKDHGLSIHQLKALYSKIMPKIKNDFALIRLEKLNPLTEALFMIMRGHNNGLENSKEDNEPACAEGAYLNIMKVFEEIEQTKNVMEDIRRIKVVLCDGTEGGLR
jgi:hypothetical protein